MRRSTWNVLILLWITIETNRKDVRIIILSVLNWKRREASNTAKDIIVAN